MINLQFRRFYMENKKIKILLAEDDPNLGTILKAFLEAKGFPAKLATNGVEANNMFLKESFDFASLMS
jgi:two-component system, OmpR family, response regulator